MAQYKVLAFRVLDDQRKEHYAGETITLGDADAERMLAMGAIEHVSDETRLEIAAELHAKATAIEDDVATRVFAVRKGGVVAEPEPDLAGLEARLVAEPPALKEGETTTFHAGFICNAYQDDLAATLKEHPPTTPLETHIAEPTPPAAEPPPPAADPTTDDKTH